MKKSILVLVCFYFVNYIHAQQKAVTENGVEVVLFDDGTWKYQNEDESTVNEVKTNPNKLKKSEEATFLLKSNNLNVGFWLNPKLWSFKKQTVNEAAEYELSLKSGDLYAMVITEKVEIPLETLKSLALENGQKVAPDLKIVKEEYRNVNGLKVLLLEMSGTTKGIKFSYYGYYYSNTNGTVQFITYTSTKLLNSYKSKIDALLNGLVELE
jgi:hypothetical protein